MTTFQDQPLSRRAVREQLERESASSAVVPTTGSAPLPVAPPSPAEPLTYTTQGRLPVPEPDGAALRPRRAAEPLEPRPDAQAPEEAQPPAGGFRPRDYSPEGRRAAPSAWAPPSGTAPEGATGATPAASLRTGENPVEHTLTRRELRALRAAHGISAAVTGDTAYPASAAEAAAAAPAASPGSPLVAPSPTLDQALAEYDQLEARQRPRGRRAAPVPVDAPQTPLAGQPVPPAPASVPVLPADPAVPAPPAGIAQPPAPQQPPAPVQSAMPAEPPALVEPPAPAAAPSSSEPVPPAPVAPAPAEPSAAVTGPAPYVEPPAVPVAPVPGGPRQVGESQVGELEVGEPEVVVAEVVPQPAPAAPEEPVVTATVDEEAVLEPEVAPATPTGHWTTQAQLDDETQYGDAAIAREVGSTNGAITTSALVLPSIPDHQFGPLATGEVLVTGSISLPEALAATGGHPAQLDEHDLDHLLDPGDHQVASTDSQPVRAIKAVSTHSASGGVIQNVKPKGTKGLTALIVAATGMAVVVGALFIVLVVTGQL